MLLHRTWLARRPDGKSVIKKDVRIGWFVTATGVCSQIVTASIPPAPRSFVELSGVGGKGHPQLPKLAIANFRCSNPLDVIAPPSAE